MGDSVHMKKYIDFPTSEKVILNQTQYEQMDELFQQLDAELDIKKHVQIYEQMLMVNPKALPARLGLAKLTGKTQVETIRQFKRIFESEKHKLHALNSDEQFDYYMVTMALVNEYLMANMPRVALELLKTVEVLSEQFDQVVPYLMLLSYCLLQDYEAAVTYLDKRQMLKSEDACVFMMVLMSIIVDNDSAVQTWLKRLKALNPAILAILKQPEEIFELVLMAEELETEGLEAVPGTSSQLAHVLYDFDLYHNNLQYIYDYFMALKEQTL